MTILVALNGSICGELEAGINYLDTNDRGRSEALIACMNICSVFTSLDRIDKISSCCFIPIRK
jgi:hypothetical protein